MTLQELRMKAKLTQVKLAAQAGLSEATIQKLERGEVLPRYETLQKLRGVLGGEVLRVEFSAPNKRNRTKG
jgi:transcriptional regulator with XRE-family HTH domain